MIHFGGVKHLPSLPPCVGVGGSLGEGIVRGIGGVALIFLFTKSNCMLDFRNGGDMSKTIEEATDLKFKRLKFFQEEGLSEDEAWDLASRLYDRDIYDDDDRALCFECQNYMFKHRTCSVYMDGNKPMRAPRFILQRCDKFNPKDKK